MMSNEDALRSKQKENARHGEAAFPVVLYNTRLHATYQDVPLHWHEEAELTMIVGGGSTYTVHTDHLESFQVQEGDLVFVPPQALHAVTTGGGEMISDTFVFHMDFLGGRSGDVCTLRYLAPLSSQKLTPPAVIRRDHPVYEPLVQLFREMGRIWEQKELGYELLVKAKLLTALAMLMPYCVRNTTETAMRTEYIEKIKAALEFMELNYGKEISISDVAAACYFSQYHFMRFFKKYMGVSCGEYLKNLRLEKAADAFSTGNTAILDVVAESGFRNVSYFYREFQKKYGFTPKKFIQQCTEAPKA